MPETLEQRDTPSIPRRHPRSLFDWNDIATQVRSLPNGKALMLPYRGSGRQDRFRNVVRQALVARGLNLYCSEVPEGVLVWEKRNSHQEGTK